MTNERPIIVKKKIVSGGGGHHGGAWKVAYADFVTAMMAFFLLMWLLNATSEDQKRGLADYFDSRIQITRSSGGGRDAFRGDSLTASKNMAESGGGDAVIKVGRATTEGVTEHDPLGPSSTSAASGADDAMQAVAKALRSASGESDVEDLNKSHMRTRATRDGLVIEFFDQPGAPLFAEDGTTPTPLLRALAETIAAASGLVTNDVAVRAAAPADQPAQTAWPLAALRAEQARQLLAESGLKTERVTEVGSQAARTPQGDEKTSPVLSFTLLRQ